MRFLAHILTTIVILTATFTADACSSAIVAASATKDGRPLLWKNRDTDATNNYLYRVEANPSIPGSIGYVGLFNGADELNLDEAWMGMNDAGFAIMNTVAYNLPAPADDWADREGIIMAQALSTCRSVDDFEALLASLPKPLGVQTNFGVIDAYGNGAYFETDDYHWVRFDLSNEPSGILIRTNYSMSGIPDKGMGYVRYNNVLHLTAEAVRNQELTPADFTEGVSRSFFNSLLGYDADARNESWVVDMDFVPRRSTTASIVVEGILPGESPEDGMRMWANIGYPPCSYVVPVTLHSIPEEAGPISPDNARSKMGLESRSLMLQAFPFKGGNRGKYLNLDMIRNYNKIGLERSLKAYSEGR